MILPQLSSTPRKTSLQKLLWKKVSLDSRVSTSLWLSGLRKAGTTASCGLLPLGKEGEGPLVCLSQRMLEAALDGPHLVCCWFAAGLPSPGPDGAGRGVGQVRQQQESRGARGGREGLQAGRRFAQSRKMGVGCCCRVSPPASPLPCG